jgi:hypothetical protein
MPRPAADPTKHFLGPCKRHGPSVELFISDRSCCACRYEQMRARRARARRMRVAKRTPKAADGATPL